MTSGPYYDNPAYRRQESAAGFANANTLGTVGNTASHLETQAQNTPIVKEFENDVQRLRSERFALQDAAAHLLPDHRVATCLKRIIPGCETAVVSYSADRGRASIHNLITCKSIWACPICAARISEERRKELTELIEGKHIEVDGERFPIHTALLTFTIGHHKGESLATVLGKIQKAYRRFTSGRWFQGFKQQFFIEGTIKAIEVTYGENGWHPHIHVLLICSSAINPAVEVSLWGMASLHWQDAVKSSGAYASLDRGLNLKVGDFKTYVSKMAGDQELVKRWTVGHELTKAPVKKGRGDEGRTILQLLADYVAGDKQAGALWVEAATTLEGTKHLTASRGLWALLGRDLATDEELAQEELPIEDSVILAELTRQEWRIVLRQEARGQLLAVADLGDREALAAYLFEIGIEIQEISYEESPD